MDRPHNTTPLDQLSQSARRVACFSPFPAHRARARNKDRIREAKQTMFDISRHKAQRDETFDFLAAMMLS